MLIIDRVRDPVEIDTEVIQDCGGRREVVGDPDRVVFTGLIIAEENGPPSPDACVHTCVPDAFPWN